MATKVEDKKNFKIGGMATLNGVFLKSKNFWTFAKRTPSGDINLQWGRTVSVLSKYPWLAKIPYVRSLILLVEAIAGGLFRAQKKNKVFRIAMSVLLVGLMFEIFYFNSHPVDLPRIYALGQLLPIPLFFIFMRLTKLASYHGAEHKTISAYEKIGGRVNLDEVREASRVHNRCGTNLSFPLMIVFGFAAWYGWGLMIQGILMLSVLEIFTLVVKNPLHLLSKGYLMGGFALQRITTKEPDDGKLEVAKSALDMLLDLEERF